MSDTKKVSTEETGAANRKYVKQEIWVAVEAGTVFAFMPGTVGEIKVKVGDKVHRGDLLMVFRAMKMNNKILSPIDGTVKNINVATGENISKNTVMIEIG